jgi:hypothetical protein|tara:strand:+ start:4631 stop:4909 length:279 start_codon:yes stop_codon:yes gene_type:complete
MPRFKNVDGVNVQFSAAEETARDAEEKVWSDAAPSREMAQIRQHRDTLLRETDHFGLGDVTMTDGMKTYRKALRDLPASNTVYADVTWPTKP